MCVLEEFLALVSNASYLLAVEVAISSVISSLLAYTCLQSPLNHSDSSSKVSLALLRFQPPNKQLIRPVALFQNSVLLY